MCLVSLFLSVCVLISCCFYITRIAAHLVRGFLMGNHRLALDCNSGCRNFSFYCYYLFGRRCLDIRSPIFTSVSTPVSCQGKKKTEREKEFELFKVTWFSLPRARARLFSIHCTTEKDDRKFVTIFIKLSKLYEEKSKL